jgi:serine/threonine protein kinase
MSIHSNGFVSKVNVLSFVSNVTLNQKLAQKQKLYTNNNVVTRSYRAPEVILGTGYHKVVDILFCRLYFW